MTDKERTTAASFHKHAKGCKHNPFECATCSSAIEWFGRLSLQTLSILLSEKPAPPMPASIGGKNNATEL